LDEEIMSPLSARGTDCRKGFWERPQLWRRICMRRHAGSSCICKHGGANVRAMFRLLKGGSSERSLRFKQVFHCATKITALVEQLGE
jgi:hypothetical protein